MGRVFAASPRSASQTSPGRGFIQVVQYFLFDRPSAYQVERVVVRRVDYLRDEGADFLRNLWFPLGQLCVQFLGERIHSQTMLRRCAYAVNAMTVL